MVEIEVTAEDVFGVVTKTSWTTGGKHSFMRSVVIRTGKSKCLPNMCLQMAKGDLDFLKERNICSACCLCSVLTMDGGACR